MIKRMALLVGFLIPAAFPGLAQDRSACFGIFCPQTKAGDYAAEFLPYVTPGSTWQQSKGKNVLIIKYYKPDGTVADTKTFPQTSYMQPKANIPDAIAFAGANTPVMSLYGLKPCSRTGSFSFDGTKSTCASVWQNSLADNLFGTQAVLCRAYIDQIDKPVQSATCIRETEGFGKDRKPGGIVIDDALTGLGVVGLSVDGAGKALRPDLTAVAAKGAKMFNSLAQ